MITKTDYAIAALIGFFTGVFAIPTLINVGVKSAGLLIALPPAVSVSIVCGVWLGKFLSRWAGIFSQFAKFAAVGLLNTAIDWGILNMLSLATGITSGFEVGGVNVPGFLAAASNAYFWNKFWVFRDRDREGVFHDFPKFFGVTLVGLLINSSIVVFATTYVSPFFGAGETVWLNLVKVGATAISLFWNFTGYKFFVFRSTSR